MARPGLECRVEARRFGWGQSRLGLSLGGGSVRDGPGSRGELRQARMAGSVPDSRVDTRGPSRTWASTSRRSSAAWPAAWRLGLSRRSDTHGRSRSSMGRNVTQRGLGWVGLSRRRDAARAGLGRLVAAGPSWRDGNWPDIFRHVARKWMRWGSAGPIRRGKSRPGSSHGAELRWLDQKRLVASAWCGENQSGLSHRHARVLAGIVQHVASSEVEAVRHKPVRHVERPRRGLTWGRTACRIGGHGGAA